jgi:Rrf2 family protein
MLSLSKKTDYALIALTYLAERPGRVASAREIASAYDLPVSLLMNILKSLHQAGILTSTRGTKGGYRLQVDPGTRSLYELIQIVDGDPQLAECTSHDDCNSPSACKVSRTCPVQSPIKALHHKLIRFLKDVKLSDLILPGHRIDVPVELVGLG